MSVHKDKYKKLSFGIIGKHFEDMALTAMPLAKLTGNSILSNI
jgi:hypothetical protein